MESFGAIADFSHYLLAVKLPFLDLCGIPENTKIEDTSFPYKTTISEANVKTNKMVSAKWTYHKERSFASNYFFFLIFRFSLRTSYKDLIWCNNDPNTHIRNFCKCWSFNWRCFFPVSILKDCFRGAFVNQKNSFSVKLAT